mmetsp:Transcript_3245/g.9229  ORF Transcript_3245/g.9229 Transcript_3245/m.9229 type:complete len:294 (-) Transcript_3245:1216-2097(-)
MRAASAFFFTLRTVRRLHRSSASANSAARSFRICSKSSAARAWMSFAPRTAEWKSPPDPLSQLYMSSLLNTKFKTKACWGTSTLHSNHSAFPSSFSFSALYLSLLTLCMVIICLSSWNHPSYPTCTTAPRAFFRGPLALLYSKRPGLPPCGSTAQRNMLPLSDSSLRLDSHLGRRFIATCSASTCIFIVLSRRSFSAAFRAATFASSSTCSSSRLSSRSTTSLRFASASSNSQSRFLMTSSSVGAPINGRSKSRLMLLSTSPVSGHITTKATLNVSSLKSTSTTIQSPATSAF